MADNGLWQKAAVGQVAENLKAGRLRSNPPSSTIPPTIRPTLRCRSWSSHRNNRGRRPPRSPSASPSPRPPRTAAARTDLAAPTPGYRPIQERAPWSRLGKQMHWAHKASTLGFAGQEVLLDAVAMTDAASHDSQSLMPHLDRLLALHPELNGKITRLLDDSAADDEDIKKRLAREYHIELLVAPKPSRAQAHREGPSARHRPHPQHWDAGVRPGHPARLLGCRHATGQFLFRAPQGSDGKPVCEGCPRKSSCCRDGGSRRQIALPFARLPWIDPRFPQLSRRFQKAYARRTVIERIHKLMKYDFGDERLTKRGNKAFQARLDKTLLAMHLVVARPEAILPVARPPTGDTRSPEGGRALCADAVFGSAGRSSHAPTAAQIRPARNPPHPGRWRDPELTFGDSCVGSPRCLLRPSRRTAPSVPNGSRPFSESTAWQNQSSLGR